MSWSVSAVGKASAVSAKLHNQLAAIKCNEPEESIKHNIATAIWVALQAFPTSAAVRVDASGSQNGSGPNDVVNQLIVKIEPLYGFVE